MSRSMASECAIAWEAGVGPKHCATAIQWAQAAAADVVQTTRHIPDLVPPNTGICHQVNLEYLARVVFTDDNGRAYPDTLVGTDSHTPMVNGLGVLGWGVGGIEAEAAMLGQPYSMVLPEVIGVKLSGKLKEGVTATDLVLTVTQMLRKRGVVGKFVEYFGPGIAGLTIAVHSLHAAATSPTSSRLSLRTGRDNQ